VAEYFAFEKRVGTPNKEETFGMYSAEMARRAEKRQDFMKWLESVQAARFLRSTLRLRLEAIKSIREFIKTFVSKHADKFEGIVSVRVAD